MRDCPDTAHYAGWILVGDSELLIKFLLGRAKPGKMQFVKVVAFVKAVARGLKRLHGYRHVPREQNAIADWLAELAYYTKCDIDLGDIFRRVT